MLRKRWIFFPSIDVLETSVTLKDEAAQNQNQIFDHTPSWSILEHIKSQTFDI